LAASNTPARRAVRPRQPFIAVAPPHAVRHLGPGFRTPVDRSIVGVPLTAAGLFLAAAATASRAAHSARAGVARSGPDGSRAPNDG
jgi:hypothetical protein